MSVKEANRLSGWDRAIPQQACDRIKPESSLEFEHPIAWNALDGEPVQVALG